MPRPRRYDQSVIYRIAPMLSDDEKVCFIGATTNFRGAKFRHKTECCDPDSYHHFDLVYRCIRERGGWDAWTIEPIHQFQCANIDEFNAVRDRWIAQLKPLLNDEIPSTTSQRIVVKKLGQEGGTESETASSVDSSDDNEGEGEGEGEGDNLVYPDTEDEGEYESDDDYFQDEYDIEDDPDFEHLLQNEFEEELRSYAGGWVRLTPDSRPTTPTTPLKVRWADEQEREPVTYGYLPMIVSF